MSRYNINPQKGSIISDNNLLSCSARPSRTDQGNISLLLIGTSVLILTGAALVASRAADSARGSGYSAQARAATMAAEAGADYLISQFNTPRNRYLLVSNGTADSQATSSAELLSTSASYDPIRQNTCATPTSGSNTGIAPAPDYTRIYPSGVASNKWYIQADGSISTAQSDKAFRIISVKRKDISNLLISKNRSAGGTSTFIITVKGEALQSGTVVAEATLEQEYEVAAKCCGVGFGGNNGPSDYSVISGKTLCLNDGLGLGILAGAAGVDTGSISVKGAANEFSSGTTDINPIYCLSTDGTTCTYSVAGSDTKVDVLDYTLKAPKTWANPSPSTISTATAPAPGNIGACTSSKNKTGTYTFSCPGLADVVASSPDNSKFLYCSDTSCSYTVVNPAAATLPSHCSTGSSPAFSSEVHCNLTRFSTKGENIVFDTSAKRLVLYFPQAGTVGESQGTDEQAQCSLSSTSFSTLTASVCVTPSSILRLTMYGCQSCGTQSLFLQGTPGANLQAFMYFPRGQVELGGTANMSGVIWSNTLYSGGSPTWTVPGSGLANVLDLMGMLPTTTGNDNPVRFDMIARSVNRSRWISN